MGKHWLLVLAIAGTPAVAAPQGNAASAGAKDASWRTQAAAVLIAREDAKSFAMAAALRHAGAAADSKAGASVPDPSAADLAARAAELAPRSASIGWLRLQICAATPACDIRDVATVMRWIDPDNGAAWLQTLSAAQKERDSTDVDRVLADMARGARFDLYWNRLVVLMVDALYAARHDLPHGVAASDATRLSMVSGIAGGTIVPTFGALAGACRESGSAPERRELCLKLSRIMQRSDTIAAQMAGFSIERRLLAPDSKEARALAERKHILEWRIATAAKLDDSLLPWTRNARARVRLAQMRANPRQEDVCIAILQKHKMALEPPEVRP